MLLLYQHDGTIGIIIVPSTIELDRASWAAKTARVSRYHVQEIDQL